MELLLSDTKKRYSELLEVAVSLSRLSEQAIVTKRKYPHIMWRYAILYRLRQEGHTYSNIAKVSGKDHSTIVHLCSQMRDIIKYNRSSQFAYVWNMFDSSVSEPVIEKKFITTVSQIDSWLTQNSVPYDLKEHLLNTITTIEA